MAPFVYRMRVRFADVDHAGIVYYPVFFHYFHAAFEEFFAERLGVRSYVELLDRDRVGFPSVSSQCDFKSALRFGDTVEIEMSVTRLGRTSVTFGYRVFRVADEVAERALCAEGSNTCAVVNLDEFQAIELSQPLRALFSTLTADSASG